jgi:hypothetical protein
MDTLDQKDSMEGREIKEKEQKLTEEHMNESQEAEVEVQKIDEITTEEGSLEENDLVSEDQTVVQESEAKDSEEEKAEQLKPVKETPEESSEEIQVDFADLSEKELVEKAKELMKLDMSSYVSLKPAMDEIKQQFYKKLKQREDELKNAFLESGGAEEDFTPPADELETELKDILASYKEKRNKEFQSAEKEKEDNLSAKQRILEELKALIENTDDFGKKVPAFQRLQQEWKSIGQVPATEVTNLWKSYQLYVETFYDNLKINNELRDYDFRKNLEIKTNLCEQAEKLADETDIVLAFRKLQILHEEWRETGPVSRENRESIWERFKVASTVINKRHHDYFDNLREKEAENLVLKTALCEKIEGIDLENVASYKEWQEKTDEIITLQEEWKKIGFAPKKDNIVIYERFRAACDKFFQKKNEFYKSVREQLNENLAKKIALCEKAEALKDNEDWKETTDKMIQLQKDWKTIGPVPKKQSDSVWKRFIIACDYFFDQKNKNFKSQKDEQATNLKRKRELIAQIQNLDVKEEQVESFKKLKALIVEWNNVGHVPFKDKDKIYKEYKTAIDAQFDRLNMDQVSRRMDLFKANIEELAEKGSQKLMIERKKLMRIYESLNNDIATYENNIGFFSGSSKSADTLKKDMEQKITKLKEERNIIFEKIKMLEETAKE